MKIAMPVQQSGITFGGFVFGTFLLVVVGIFGLRLIPAYMQDATIKNIFNVIAHDPDMQKASPQDIRASFDRRSSIDDIKAINSSDIEISVNQGRLLLSANYFVKIPLAGNVSLYLDFNPTSAQ